MRAVQRSDFPDNDGAWRSRVERKLEELFQRVASKQPAVFRDGIVPSTALAGVAAPGGVLLTTSNFPVAVAGGVVLTADVTVPPRMSACVVALAGCVYAKNGTAATDFLTTQVQIAGVQGNGLPIKVLAGDFATPVSRFLTQTLTGLTPGSTFTVQVLAKTTNAGWAAVANNIAELSGTLGWSS